MLGGVMGGYCATGKLNAATVPASVITIDRTDAKIGRSMKKCENIPGFVGKGTRPFLSVRSQDFCRFTKGPVPFSDADVISIPCAWNSRGVPAAFPAGPAPLAARPRPGC